MTVSSRDELVFAIQCYLVTYFSSKFAVTRVNFLQSISKDESEPLNKFHRVFSFVETYLSEKIIIVVCVFGTNFIYCS